MNRRVLPTRRALAAAALLTCSTCLLTQLPTAMPTAAEGIIRPVETCPRIVALNRRLASGDRRALDEFWSEARRVGTPLMEPSKDSTAEVTVTFVWRGDARTQNVALQAPLTNLPGMPTLQLSRLPDTDVWYRCWRMRNDLRFTYRFLLDVKPGDNPQQSARIDPLNPHRMEISLDENGTAKVEYSIASMPHASDESWTVRHPAVAAGAVAQHLFKSTILGNERAIWVYTPPGYDAKTRGGYPLLVLFDGFSYQNWIPAPVVLDNLIHAEKISPMVAVLIGNARNTRSSELGYNAAFVEFLSQEVLPWVHGHGNVTRDPQKSIIGGYSFGGVAAAFVALRRPDMFGNVLSQSGAFWRGKDKDVTWEWLVGQYEAAPKLPLRFFLEAGLLEDVSRDGPTPLAANRRLVTVLKHKGYAVTYQEVGGTHEPVHWHGEFAEGLLALAK